MGAREIAVKEDSYAPECVDKGVFSEVRRSKQPIRRTAKRQKTAWRDPVGLLTRRLRYSRCTIVYQAVATRNEATTGEIPAHWTAVEPNFRWTAFYEVCKHDPA
jgi:hypothetical protein